MTGGVPRPTQKQPTEADKLMVEAWKVAVDVQKHFNDLKMRIRTFAVSFLGVVLGAAAVAWQQSPNRYLAAIIVYAGLVGWWSFYLMDGGWYHRLLKGAVVHGTNIEKALEASTGLNVFNLAQEISAKSPAQVGTEGLQVRVHSSFKLRLFYGSGAGALSLLLAGVFWLPRPPAEKDLKTMRVILSRDSVSGSAPTPATAPIPSPRSDSVKGH